MTSCFYRRVAQYTDIAMAVIQQYTQAYLAEDRGWELIQVAIIFAVLETLFLCLFFASRALNKTLNGLDVYFIPPAYIFCFSHVIMAIRK
jgi:hypothetical protein